MSQLDDTIKTVTAVKDHYAQAVTQIQSAINESDTGIAQGTALGFEGVVEVFEQAKSSLEQLTATTKGLDAQLDAIVAGLQAGKG